MFKKIFFYSTMLPLGFAALSLVASGAGRPNILWLTAEDHSAYWLGCYGNENARTPNLDKLAERGVRYTNFFANAPVCAVARTSLILGTYAPQLGLQHMRSVYDIPGKYKTYSRLLQDAGYYVTNRSKDDFNFPYDPEKVWSDVGGDAHYKNRSAGAPFFTIFNTTTTHESSLFPSRYNRSRESGIIPDKPRVDPADVRLPAYLPDLPEIRMDHAIYHDVISAMDREIGDHLAELEARGEADNTIIFFYSDHGGVIPRAKRFVHDTGTHVPLIIYFPEKWKHLAPAAPGSEIDDPVSFIDLPPTILNLAGADVPEYMHGTPLFGTPEASGPRSLVFLYGQRFDGQILKFERAVTDGHYRYIHNFHPFRPQAYPHGYPLGQAAWSAWYEAWRNGETSPLEGSYWERNQPVDALFHTDSDPWEVNNLAGDPEYAARLAFMRDSLINQMAAIRDTGIVPESMWPGLIGDGTIFDYVNQADFPYRSLLDLAFEATDASQASLPRFQFALTSEHPVERYWGAIGCHILGREAKPAARALRKLTRDPFLVNRIAAYAALGQLGQRKFAIEGLLGVLDAPVENMALGEALDALLGLNALDQVGNEQLQAIIDRTDRDHRSLNLVAQAASEILKTR